MPSKLVIITGGNSGLGYECAKTILQSRDWMVLIASRSLDNCQRAVASLREAIPSSSNSTVDFLLLDLSSFESIKKFVSDFKSRKEELPQLHALICNAGLQFQQRSVSKEGYEATFAVNHLGHFLLVNLMLKEFTEGRIIFVASEVHDPAKKTGMPDPVYQSAIQVARDEPGQGEDITVWGRKAYSTSKLCNVFCTYELARRLRSSRPDLKITVNAMDPGLMPGTGLAREYNCLLKFGWNCLLPLLIPFMRNVNTTAQSGAQLAKLAIDPAFEGVTGKYFEGSREIRSSDESYDQEKAADLWRSSVQMSLLTSDDILVPEFLV
jgi:NAD(P)-dependent dehydrogenase (short-subunit alcohol dehydrogenase family)